MKKALLILLSATALTACNSEDDLEQFFRMAENAKPPVEKHNVQEKSADVLHYVNQEQVDPFNLNRPRRLQKTHGINEPDFARSRTPLEMFSLDTLKMVGFFIRFGVPHAIIRTPASELYNVRVGGWIGQDYGRVIAVEGNKIDIEETVQDGTGDWLKRNVTMRLEREQGE